MQKMCLLGSGLITTHYTINSIVIPTYPPFTLLLNQCCKMCEVGNKALISAYALPRRGLQGRKVRRRRGNKEGRERDGAISGRST